MIKLYLVVIIIFFVSVSYSQSKIEIEKQSLLYKTNNVKIQTIDFGNGKKIVIKYNKNGKPSESHDYYDNIEVNITNYKYDKKFRLIEKSYFGYESGDGILEKYYYDDIGNVVKIISSGSDDSETNFFYDIHGNEIRIEIHWPDPETAPYSATTINTYEDNKLISSEQECTHRTNEVNQSKFTYNEDKLILIEDFWKYCQTNKIEFHTKESFEYFENGLIKESIKEGKYNETPEKKVYSYEFY